MRTSDGGMGTNLISLFIFAIKWAFPRQHTSGGLLTVLLWWHFMFCWADTPSAPVVPLLDKWYLLQTDPVCLSCLPGSFVELAGWLLTRVIADTMWCHCQFQGHSIFITHSTHPSTPIHHREWFIWSSLILACGWKARKTTPEEAYPPATKDTQILRESWHWL